MTADRIAIFRKKVEDKPTQVFFRYSLAQAYFEGGDFESASIEFQKCLASKPEWMMASLFAGKAELHLGNLGEAEAFLQKTVVLAKEQNHDDPLIEAKSLLDQISDSPHYPS